MEASKPQAIEKGAKGEELLAAGAKAEGSYVGCAAQCICGKKME